VNPAWIVVAADIVGLLARRRFQVAGITGALAATAAAFLAPGALAGLAARGVRRFANHRLLRSFGAGAAPAAARRHSPSLLVTQQPPVNVRASAR
jgi:hypothetical protein